MKVMSTRQQRISEQIRQLVTEELARGDFADPRINGMLSVPHVWISPDLRQCRVFYSSLSQPNATRDEMRDLTLSLNNEAYRLQKEMGRQLTMKYIPRLHFFFDDQNQNTSRIEEIFAKINSESSAVLES